MIVKMGRINSKLNFGANLILQRKIAKLFPPTDFSWFASRRPIMPISQGSEISGPSPKKCRAELSTSNEGGCGANSPLGVQAEIRLQFAKLTPNAFTPTKGSALAAGFDLYSAYDYVVPSKGKLVALTDIQIALPDGCYGRVAPRSGLAAKHFIDVGAGVIDQDYRGNVGVVLFNFAEEDFKVNKGDRIAQLILERIYIPVLEELPSLDDTTRGSGGFGSTG